MNDCDKPIDNEAPKLKDDALLSILGPQSIQNFRWFKHARECMELLKEQWGGLNYTDSTTNVFHWLYLLEILRMSHRLFVKTVGDSVVGMSGYSVGTTKNIWYQFLFRLLKLYIYLRYSKSIYEIYKIYNFYQPYIKLVDGELTILVVSKGMRSLGHGKEIVQYSFNAAKAYGHKKLLICTYEQYCDASFYEAVGCKLFTSFLDPDPDGPCLCSIFIKDL